MYLKKVITALLVASAVLVGGAAESSAAVPAHSVEKGDSLYRISGIHGVSISNLMKWNSLESTVIYPNQRLVVASGAENALATVHKVEKGDSLSKISVMYNVSISNLKSWNNLNTTIIQPNQELSVAGNANAAQKATSAPVAAPKAVAKETPKAAAEPKAVAKETPKAATAPAAAPKAAAKETPKVTQETPSNDAKKEFTVSATAYTANCDGCSGVTKTGINLKQNPDMKVIAVDPSVIKLGTKVHVEGYGDAIAGDIGGAIKGNKIDVFISSKDAATNWGRKDVKVTILD